MFLRKHTNMSYRSCEILHEMCYHEHGHTVKMLNSMFDKRVSLEEYNEYVYDKTAMSNLKKQMDAQTIDRFVAFTETKELCENNNVDWAIFTNADRAWVDYFFKSCGWTHTPPVHFPTSLSELKPNEAAYDKIERLYKDGRKLWFVDDQRVNLLVPKSRPRWITMHFTPRTTRDNIHTFFGLQELRNNRKI